MRVGEIRIYNGHRLEERCEAVPIRDAEKAALEYAQMIAKDEYQKGTAVVVASPRNIRVGRHRVRVLNAGSF
jgi:hypothetical protein